MLVSTGWASRTSAVGATLPAGRRAEALERQTMDYSGLVKKLSLPAGQPAPARLVYEDVVATAITRDDLADDVAGINGSLQLIAETRGGGWPTGPVSPDYNYVDLVWHEQEFREGSSFTYVVRDTSAGYLGCLYLYPVGVRTPLSEQLLACDVDVSWWVTSDAYAAGYYAKLYEAIQHWLTSEFPFWKPHFSNVRMPDER